MENKGKFFDYVTRHVSNIIFVVDVVIRGLHQKMRSGDLWVRDKGAFYHSRWTLARNLKPQLAIFLLFSDVMLIDVELVEIDVCSVLERLWFTFKTKKDTLRCNSIFSLGKNFAWFKIKLWYGLKFKIPYDMVVIFRNLN